MVPSRTARVSYRQEFFFATPGTTNNGSSAPLSVVINEWMAANTHTIADPLDGNKFDDWFRLYNYGAITADLTGYYLTDSLTNQFDFQIPAGYTRSRHWLPAGRLGRQEEHHRQVAGLHVNFKLSKSGTSIGLYGADGNLQWITSRLARKSATLVKAATPTAAAPWCS